jgi:hypothetical protein
MARTVWPQPMVAVRDVDASRRFYLRVLGAESGHGGNEYEQVVNDGDPDGYLVVLAGPSDWRPRGS